MLTGKQKRYLRSLAVNEKAIFQIGKEGLSENLYVSLKEALKARELVKVSVLKTCEVEMNEIVIDTPFNCCDNITIYDLVISATDDYKHRYTLRFAGGTRIETKIKSSGDDQYVKITESSVESKIEKYGTGI